MAKHERGFDKGLPFDFEAEKEEGKDAYRDKPREDLLIRFLSGEEIDEEMDGAFARLKKAAKSKE